jgi:bacterioferritin
MKQEQKSAVVEMLNRARAMELHAIVQYMNQHYNLDDMDYGLPAGKVKLIAIDEMRHAEMFAERIKELGGEPLTDRAAKVEHGQEVEAIFGFDSLLEDDTIAVYSQFLARCRETGDTVTARMFETVIGEEQVHLNYFENEKGHIEKLGAAYLATWAGTSPATGLPAALGFAATRGGE